MPENGTDAPHWRVNERVEPIARTRWALQWWGLSLVFLIPIFIFVVLLSVLSGNWLLQATVRIGVMLVLSFVTFRTIAGAYYRRYRYWLLPDKVVVHQGLLILRTNTLTYDRIQNVNVHRNIFDRIFRVGSVAVQSAGANNPLAEVRVVALSVEDANAIAKTILDMVRGVDAPVSISDTHSRTSHRTQAVSRAAASGDIYRDGSFLDALVRINEQLQSITQQLK